MPYDISWTLENRILFIRIYNTVTIEEINELANQTQQSLIQAAGDQNLYVVVNLQELEHFPNNIFQMKKLLETHVIDQPPVTIIYGMSYTVSLLVKALTRLLNSPFRFADNESHALDILAALEPNLNIDTLDPLDPLP